MADMGRRKPSADEPLHTLPLDSPLLASPFERVMPEVTDREAEVSQCIPVARYSEVSDMPTHNRFQPLADFRNRIMHTPAGGPVIKPLNPECPIHPQFYRG